MMAQTATKEKTKKRGNENGDGAEQIRRSPMMARLLDDLGRGEDVGHYGRLTFAMVARYFMEPDAIVALLAKQPDQDESKASAMVMQVADRGYSPPRRERIMEWQAKQDYPIIANPDDPDDGNVYRDLEFPDALYDHISEYHEDKVEARERE